MTKTPAEQQIEILKAMKAGKAAPAPLTPALGAPAAKAAVKKAPAKGHSLNVDAKTWGRLDERRKSEFKDTRKLAAWAAQLVLALPEGVAALEPEAQKELFSRMREWAETKGLH